MNRTDLVRKAAAHAALAAAYIGLVALFMNYGEYIFDGEDTPEVFVAMGMLGLFVLSAAVMAALFFGRPVIRTRSSRSTGLLRRSMRSAHLSPRNDRSWRRLYFCRCEVCGMRSMPSAEAIPSTDVYQREEAGGRRNARLDHRALRAPPRPDVRGARDRPLNALAGPLNDKTPA